MGVNSILIIGILLGNIIPLADSRRYLFAVSNWAREKVLKSLVCCVLHGSHTDFARICFDDWGKIGGSWGFLPYEMYKILSKTLTEAT
jgi:hypothetical protein